MSWTLASLIVICIVVLAPATIGWFIKRVKV
jgi:hypothetical protein